MSDDDSAPTTYELHGERLTPHRMRVAAGDATFEVDTGCNPVEYLLGSLLGCLNFTGTAVAREMGIDIERLDATVEGDIDYARYKGEETDARAGLQAVRVALTVEADADDAALEEWLATVEARCPISDTIADGTDLGVAVERA